MIKNIIFDWCGTLSDDFILVYSTAMNIFKKLGLKTIPIEQYRKEFCLPYMDFYKKYTNTPKEELDKYFLEEFTKLGEPKLFLGVKGSLETLKKKGFNMIILSSHQQPKLEKEIENNGLNGCFLEVIGSTHDKLKVIKDIVRTHKFSSEETVYVGDMVHDIKAGKKADLKTVGITWGFQDRSRLGKASPDFLIDDITELEGVLENVQ